MLETLSSVEKRKAYCRNVFKEIGLGKFYPNKDNSGLFLELLEYHPEKKSKIGCGIKYFHLQNNKFQKGTFHIDIVRKDNTRVSFSWGNCCKLYNFKICKKDMLKQAFRASVNNQILDYLHSNPDKKCNYCGFCDNIQIDHIEPFSNILNGFISKKDGFEFPEEFDKNEFHQCIFKKEDSELKKEWDLYHKEKATYQYLCRSCNVRKSNN